MINLGLRLKRKLNMLVLGVEYKRHFEYIESGLRSLGFIGEGDVLGDEERKDIFRKYHIERAKYCGSG